MAQKIATSSRNPYPYPLCENDNTFQGGVFERKEPYGLGDHLMGQNDPWVRLNKTPTLSSARREVFHYDPKAPNDSLDFCIKAEYDQHNEFLACSAEVRRQKETNGNPEGRVLVNRVAAVPKVIPELGHPLIKAEQKEHRSIHQNKGAIGGNHQQNTNRGYSRKIDGGFFNI